MGTYSFEGVMTVCDTTTIEAESYEEALEEARQQFEDQFYSVTPHGYSMPWDNIEVNCIFEPEED